MTGPHPDPLALDAHLEPSALYCGFDVREPIVAALSTAVSLKRIADALEALTALTSGDGVHQAHTALHFAITNAAYEAGRSFQAGTRSDR